MASSSFAPFPASTKLAVPRKTSLLASPCSTLFASPSSPGHCCVSVSTSPFLLFSVVLGSRRWSASRIQSVAEVDAAAASAERDVGGGATEGVDEKKPAGGKARLRPFELYVCNLPRSTDISDLLDVFSPYGTVQSVEVSRNPETGVSRGCGFVTMSSILEATEAVTALDGSELGGRELRVRFSAEMASGRKNTTNLNTDTRKVIFYEGPHKIYVGNLPWSVQPADLRQHFSQFGMVVSIKLFRDRKSGKRRMYGFLSFSSIEELQAAVSSSGTDFCGRPLLVREVNARNQE
ncbi:unnamed protein product [Spirodela intermedia]|uniref:RRM domain-containing protein n=1 Tax=Spirodela intermedia TaxID=51605 RepID=A0A7I8LM47_SPIIN|nr:unnamed protein product [Spirodela intermedia]